MLQNVCHLGGRTLCDFRVGDSLPSHKKPKVVKDLSFLGHLRIEIVCHVL